MDLDSVGAHLLNIHTSTRTHIMHPMTITPDYIRHNMEAWTFPEVTRDILNPGCQDSTLHYITLAMDYTLRL